MTKQELANKSDKEKKDHVFQGRSTQRGPQSGGLKLEDHSKQIGSESAPETLLSLLTSPEFSHPVNESQKANMINHLQQTYGNAHVRRVIQAKLKISKPKDKYEQEADTVADLVTYIAEPETSGDKACARETPKPSENWQGKSVTMAEVEGNKLAQEKNMQERSHDMMPHSETRIQSLRYGGSRLLDSVRAFFEPRFGYDFSKVRLHTDARASGLARSLNARAFTMGHDIVFGAGQYVPGTAAGKRLLAHELTHVVQQNSDEKMQNIDNYLHAGGQVNEIHQRYIQCQRTDPTEVGVTGVKAPEIELTPEEIEKKRRLWIEAAEGLPLYKLMLADLIDRDMNRSFVLFIEACKDKEEEIRAAAERSAFIVSLIADVVLSIAIPVVGGKLRSSLESFPRKVRGIPIPEKMHKAALYLSKDADQIVKSVTDVGKTVLLKGIEESVKAPTKLEFLEGLRQTQADYISIVDEKLHINAKNMSGTQLVVLSAARKPKICSIDYYKGELSKLLFEVDVRYQYETCLELQLDIPGRTGEPSDEEWEEAYKRCEQITGIPISRYYVPEEQRSEVKKRILK